MDLARFFNVFLIMLLLSLFSTPACKLGTLGGSDGEVEEPENLSLASLSSSQIAISWEDNSSNEDGFTVERAEDEGGAPGSWSVVAQVDADIENYSDSGLNEARVYWYRVFARSTELGDSKKAGPKSAETRLGEALNFEVLELGDDSIEISWSDNSDFEEGYIIERAEDQGDAPGTWTELVELGEDTESHIDDTVSPNDTYWYRVYAFSSEYQDSNYTSHLFAGAN